MKYLIQNVAVVSLLVCSHVAVFMMKKVLTYLLLKPFTSPTPAIFTECVVGIMHDHSGNPDETLVTCWLEDDCFIVGKPSGSEKSCVLRRPTFCPLKHMTADQASQLPLSSKSRGVDVGVASLLESSDNLLLITKRSQTMRTFPNVWVPPGGHVEIGETLFDAGLRELREETGITVQPAGSSCGEAQILGLWESAFPPVLSPKQLPLRHHIVTYLTVKDCRSAEEINDSLKLDESEVEQCAWVCRHLAAEIISTDRQFNVSDSSNLSPKTCHAKYCFRDATSKDDFVTLGAVIKDSKTASNFIRIKPLLNAYSHEKQLERVSTGTKFALKLWLEKNFII